MPARDLQKHASQREPFDGHFPGRVAFLIGLTAVVLALLFFGTQYQSDLINSGDYLSETEKSIAAALSSRIRRDGRATLGDLLPGDWSYICVHTYYKNPAKEMRSLLGPNAATSVRDEGDAVWRQGGVWSMSFIGKDKAVVVKLVRRGPWGVWFGGKSACYCNGSAFLTGRIVGTGVDVTSDGSDAKAGSCES